MTRAEMHRRRAAFACRTASRLPPSERRRACRLPRRAKSTVELCSARPLAWPNTRRWPWRRPQEAELAHRPRGSPNRLWPPRARGRSHGWICAEQLWAREPSFGSRSLFREIFACFLRYVPTCSSHTHPHFLFSWRVFAQRHAPVVLFRQGGAQRSSRSPPRSGRHRGTAPHRLLPGPEIYLWPRSALSVPEFRRGLLAEIADASPSVFLGRRVRTTSSSAAPEQKRRQSDARGPAAAFLALFTGAMPSFKPPAGARAAFEETHTFSKPTGCSCAGAPSSSAAASSPAAGSTQQKPLLKLLSVQLKDTYRKVNPERPVGCDTAPRRFLTHPSQAVANG